MKKFLYAFVMLMVISGHGYSQGTDKPKYRIDTYRLQNFLGSIEIELFPIIAPLHVQNFDSLVSQQFYDSTAFHRVVPGFVIQGGDPNTISGPMSTWGQGQPWQPTVPAEFNAVRHLRGIIGAARDTNINSANSQFYICVGSPTYLDGNYTVYGRVTSGMNIVDSIALSPRDVATDIPLQKISMFVTAIGTNPSVPAAPQLNLPADSASSVVNTQFFSWAAVDSAVLYTIQFSTDSLFNTITWSDTLALTQSAFPGMAGLTRYYWRVRSNNGGHESPWTVTRTFTSTTGAATGIYPVQASTAVPVNLNFIWTSVPGATSYTLQVSTSPTFTISSMVVNQSGITDTTQLVSNLQTNRLYYWRVQSDNNGAPGMFSAKYYFTTGTSTGLSEVKGTLLLNAPWPNPAGDYLNLQVQPMSGELLHITLYDVNGKTALQESGPPATFRQLELSNLNSGVYLLELRQGSAYTRCSVMINRELN